MSTSDRPPFPEIQPPETTLGKVLGTLLATAGSPLRVKGFEELFGQGSPWWATAHQGARKAQVTLALHERRVLTDLWERGVQVARHAGPELAATAELLRDWLERGCSMQDLTRHAGITVLPRAAIVLAGAEAEVTEAWKELRRFVEREHPSLLPLVDEAERTPALRRLYPYTSHGRLSFSRCTGSPFTTDCPLAWPDADGFQIILGEAKPSYANGAREAVRRILELLPKGIGPAIQGTAEDVERRSAMS